MNKFCAMFDVSRNGVMLPEKVKEYIGILKNFGYNGIMLYTEDTYEIPEEPYFGYMRGRYTKSEIKEIDEYALSRGVELIPCIQTLAHLDTVFDWREYGEIHDVRDILLVGEKRTYELIGHMFDAISECFSSRTVFVGMDEAPMLGRGKYLDKNGYTDGLTILSYHVEKVCEIARDHGFNPVMWSDMLLKSLQAGKSSDCAKAVERIKKSGMGQAYWDYSHSDTEYYVKNIEIHDSAANDFWFAGGAWTWGGFAPDTSYSMANTKAAMSACREKHIKNVVITVWGDNGKECSFFAALPMLFYAKEIYDGNCNESDIKNKFHEITGEDFDDFVALELPQTVNGRKDRPYNPAKYMLYNDCFLGVFDSTVAGGESEYYKKASEYLDGAAARSNKYAYIFKCEKLLCDCLEYKYELGIRTRTVYWNNDKEQISALITEYGILVGRLERFLSAFRKMWLMENKPYGIEVHEQRLGGLICRIKNCKNRLSDYVKGRVKKIPELEEKVLNYEGQGGAAGRPVEFNWWEKNVTPNVM